MSNTAIITGGSKRIGRSIALTLADMGFDIALHYKSSRKDALEAHAPIVDSQKSGRFFGWKAYPKQVLGAQTIFK